MKLQLQSLFLLLLAVASLLGALTNPPLAEDDYETYSISSNGNDY